MVDKLDQQQDIVNETNSKSEEFSKLNSKGKQQVVDQILKLSGSMKSENAKINGFLATAKQIQEETKKIEDMKKLQTDFEKAMTTAENKKNRTDEEFTKAKKAEKLFEKNPETEDYANKLAALKNATKIAKIAQEAAEDDYNTINKLIGQGIGQVKELNDKTLLTEEQLKYLKNPENTGRIGGKRMLKTKINDQQDKIDNLNKDIQKYYKTFTPTETAILQKEKDKASVAEREKSTGETVEQVKNFKAETEKLLDQLAPNVSNKLSGKDKTDFDLTITTLRNDIRNAKSSAEIINLVDVQLQTAGDKVDGLNKGIVKRFAGDMLDGIKNDLVAGQNSFNKLKNKYRKVEQVTAANVLSEAYSKHYFENPEYEKKFFNETFDKAKTNTLPKTDKDKFEFMIWSYATAGKETTKQIDQKNMKIEYYKDEVGTSGDEFVDSYNKDTRVIKVSEMGEGVDIAKTTYIVFGTKEDEYINKSKKYLTKNEGGKEVNNLKPEDFEKPVGKVDLNAFDIAGPEVFKLYLMKKDQKDFSKENMTDILTRIKEYTNLKASSEQEGIRNGFYSKFIEAITEKSKQNGNILVGYLDLVRADIDESVKKGEGNLGLDKLGANLTEQQKNFAMINAYINTDIANKTNKTDTDLAILAQRDLLNLKMNPKAEKPSGNMLEKLMNNPALINILLTIAEMFGGKAWLKSMFAKSPKILEKIDALYLKEFAISDEKRSAITDIYSTYDAKREKKETLPDNTKYPMFTDTFNKEDVWFDGGAMETSLSAMTERNWSAMDKNILQKVMTKNNIVIDNFITKNTKGEEIVDGKAIIASGKKELLVACMMKDADIRKAVKVAYDKTADQHYPKKAGEKITDNKERFANGDDVALTFSAYAVGGSKGNFYNVLTENKLFDKNKTKQDNVKDEAEANEKLATLKEKNERVGTANNGVVNTLKAKTDYEKDTKDTGDVKTKKIKELTEAFDKATADEKTAVYKDLSGIFTQERKDLPENNSRSEYAQLTAKSKDYTALYDPKNINIFLNAFQESLKDATNATLANTIDATKLANAISYMKDGKAAVAVDKGKFVVTNGANSFILEPGCFLKEEIKIKEDQKIVENKKNKTEEKQPENNDIKELTTKDVIMNTTQINEKYLNDDGTLKGIKNNVGLKDIIKPEITGPLFLTVGKNNKTLYDKTEGAKNQVSVGKDNGKRLILDAEGKPTTKLATIADGDKITTGKEDNLRADNIIAILKTSKEYKDARDKMNGMLNTYKKTLESAGITVNTNASITRESSKINFTPNDKVKMDAVAGKEGFVQLYIDQPSLTEDQKTLLFTKSINSITKDNTGKITMNVKDKDGKIVNWTLSPIKENSSNTVVNNNQTTENNNQIIKNNQDKGISANKNINTTDVSITPTFNQKEPLTGKGGFGNYKLLTDEQRKFTTQGLTNNAMENKLQAILNPINIGIRGTNAIKQTINRAKENNSQPAEILSNTDKEFLTNTLHLYMEQTDNGITISKTVLAGEGTGAPKADYRPLEVSVDGGETIEFIAKKFTGSESIAINQTPDTDKRFTITETKKDGTKSVMKIKQKEEIGIG